jgi:SAM-dependent methyltransferase
LIEQIGAAPALSSITFEDDPMEVLTKALSHSDQMLKICNICGSEEFTFGSLTRGRATHPPQCARCKTVERHRIVRNIYGCMRPLLTSWRAFQFAPDRSVERGWFASFEASVFDSKSSVDMMNTGFADGEFDLVISNHVLEHVADDVQALRETLRIVGPAGIVHVCVPSPIQNWDTQDWGRPDPNVHSHYRLYGADFPLIMCKRIEDLCCIGVAGADPVTASSDLVYFFSYDLASLKCIGKQLQHFEIPIFRYT